MEMIRIARIMDVCCSVKTEGDGLFLILQPTRWIALSKRLKSVMCFWWRRIDATSDSKRSPSADVQNMNGLAIHLDFMHDGSWFDRILFLSSARFIILYVPDTDLIKLSATSVLWLSLFATREPCPCGEPLWVHLVDGRVSGTRPWCFLACFSVSDLRRSRYRGVTGVSQHSRRW